MKSRRQITTTIITPRIRRLCFGTALYVSQKRRKLGCSGSESTIVCILTGRDSRRMNGVSEVFIRSFQNCQFKFVVWTNTFFFYLLSLKLSDSSPLSLSVESCSVSSFCFKDHWPILALEAWHCSGSAYLQVMQALRRQRHLRSSAR